MILALAPFEKRFIAGRLKIYKLHYAEVYDIYYVLVNKCETKETTAQFCCFFRRWLMWVFMKVIETEYKRLINQVVR